MYRVSTQGRYAPDWAPQGSPGGGRRITKYELAAISRFSKDDRGDVAMLFGLMFIVMLVLIGAAVDMGRWMQARRTTLEAIDSAVLAGLKKYQDTSDTTAALTLAAANYKYNVANRNSSSVTTDTIAFQLTNNNTSMTATGNVTFKMPFLGLANMATLPLLKTDGSELAVSKVAVGANTGTSLEVSVMIDITGSMGESDNSGSTKIETVKKAAANLVDIIVWADQSQYTSKVAIVPFSETVNLGTAALANSARGTIKWGQTSSTPGSEGYTFSSSWGDQTYYSSTKCVTERTGADKYTDTSPTTSPVGRHYSSDGSCPTKSVVMPLSNDTSALKSLISSLKAGGSTAGHIGTAWAWYMLSPNFNDLWPTASDARPYADLTTLNSKGKPILQKIAILMTDGDYNTQYCNGVNTGYGGCSPSNDNSQNQASALCTAMKAKGITVYTIGAQVSSNAKAFLQSCATDVNHYYDATDGTKLNQAFIDIAYKLVPPYLIH